MLTIHKYPVPSDTGLWGIALPKGATLLKIDWQESVNRACLWCLVDPDAPPELHAFRIYGTGWQIRPEEVGSHVATWQTPGGFVWHAFRDREDERRRQTEH